MILNSDHSLRFVHDGIDGDFSFVHLSDLQLGMPARAFSRGERRSLRLEEQPYGLGTTDDAVFEVVSAVNRKAPDLVIISGDIVDFYDPYNLDLACRVIECFNCPVYLTLGNHDIARYVPPDQWLKGESDTKERWRSRFRLPSFSYAFRHKGMRFIALDTSFNRVETSDLEWLQQILSDEPGVPTLLFYHVPAPIPSLVPEVKRMREKYYCLDPGQDTDRFMEILSLFPCIISTFCGHIHFYSAHRCGGALQTSVYPACYGGYRTVTVQKS